MNYRRGIATTVITALLFTALFTGCAGSAESPAAQPPEASAPGDNGSEAEEADPEDAEEGEYTRALARRSQNSEKSDPTITPTEAAPGGSQKSYTVMIYMIGSNLESRLGNATKDLEEIESAGLSFDDFNVVVYTGGSARWVGNVPCDRNCVLDMSLPEDNRIVAETEGNANMGLPETLSSFLSFCDEKYPAEHNALILWDHGGGPLWGYGSDELYDSDSLLLDEMKAAMDASPFHGEKKLDLIGFDACLMASLECMSIWQDYADYYVGSEELEPGDGWDYSFLKALEDSSDTESLAGSVLQKFETYYEAKKSASYNPDLTLSFIDLSAIGAVNEKLDALADRMADGIDNGDYVTLMRSRSEAKSFGMARDRKGEVSFYYDLVDVGNLAEQMAAYYPEEAAGVQEALKEAVLTHYANIDDTCGMTLYYPYKNKGQFEQLNEYYGNINRVKGYSGFLRSAGNQFMSSKSRDWTLGEPVDNGDEYTLQLTEEMLSNMTECTYTVMVRNDTYGLIVPYLEYCTVKPDKNGIIHIEKNLPMAVLRNGDSMALIRAAEVESDRKRTVYRTTQMMLRGDLTYDTHIEDLESADASILFSRVKKSGKTEILNIEMADNASGVSGGKNTVNLKDWEGISILAASDCYIPARDAGGRIRPYEEWTRSHATTWSTLSVDEEVSFDIVGLDQVRGQESVILQIEISDTNGEKYASEPVVVTNTSFRTERVPVGSGTLVFALYEDHAELIGYSGREEVIEVPEKAGGLPVTVIAGGAFSWHSIFDSLGYNPVKKVTIPDTVTELGDGVFSSCFKLEEVRLPAGLKKIGDTAFSYCYALKAIELPDSLESIGKCAFAYCTSLTGVGIPKGIRSIGTGAFMNCIGITKFTGGMVDSDGAIYSADQKVLLACPAAAGERFAVKPGTEKIAYGAFAGASVREVMLPEGLREIGNYAFYDCGNLSAPVFPESLVKIGMHAYDSHDYGIKAEMIPEEEEVIRIPASLESIGDRAFDKFVRARYEVSGENRHYKEVGGALMNKAGDTVHQLVADPDGTAVYPEGTVKFEEEALAVYDSLFDDVVKNIYLPESMNSFPDQIRDYKNRDDYALYHCPAGSEAEKFAVRMGLHFTNEMEKVQEKLETKTAKGTLYFDLYSDHAVLYGYSGEDEVVEVPAEAGGKPVTAIGNGIEPISVTFDFDDIGRENTALVKIVIPEGVTAINAKALSDLRTYAEVVLPPTVRRLGREAISNYSPVSGSTEGLEILEAGSAGNYRERPFVLTPGIRYIDGDAFSGSEVSAFEQSGENEFYSVRDGILYSADGTLLVKYPTSASTEEFAVPEGTVTIGERAFLSNKTIQKVTLPVSLKEIGTYAFSYCTALREIAYEEGTSLSKIGEQAFYNCTGLTEVTLPPAETIERSAFDNCEALASVHFAEGTKAIGNSAFSRTALAAPELPASLRKIGDYAFGEYKPDECRAGSPDVVHIPAKVNEIGSDPFTSIGNTKFEVDPENRTYSSVDGLLLDKDGNSLLLCPAGRKGRVTVPDGVTAIMAYAFSSAYGVTDIEIPDSVLYIDTVNFDPLEDEDGSSSDEPRYAVTLHCSKGSYAEWFAASRGIPCKTK